MTVEFDAWVDLLMCSMEGIVIEGYGAGSLALPALAILKRLVLDTLHRGEDPKANASTQVARRR